MGYSVKCKDLKTYWDRTQSKCVFCSFRPGNEIAPNCGLDDAGGRHERPSRPCSNGTFNNGSWAYCQPCTLCHAGFNTVSSCNLTTDTQCQYQSNPTTAAPTNQGSSLTPVTELAGLSPHHGIWAVPLVILISTMLALLSAWVLCMRRQRGQQTVLGYNRQSSFINAGYSSPTGNNDLEDILSPTILSAPLQSVLDNLDVLEELMILLDPEGQGVKNTKHLASHCSFPSTWITYTYSMKDSKSPLKAVLEGVTSRHPEWTVWHLAKMLKLMKRNDAIVVLAKLPLNKMDM